MIKFSHINRVGVFTITIIFLGTVVSVTFLLNKKPKPFHNQRSPMGSLSPTQVMKTGVIGTNIRTVPSSNNPTITPSKSLTPTKKITPAPTTTPTTSPRPATATPTSTIPTKLTNNYSRGKL